MNYYLEDSVKAVAEVQVVQLMCCASPRENRRMRFLKQIIRRKIMKINSWKRLVVPNVSHISQVSAKPVRHNLRGNGLKAQ